MAEILYHRHSFTSSLLVIGSGIDANPQSPIPDPGSHADQSSISTFGMNRSIDPDSHHPDLPLAFYSHSRFGEVHWSQTTSRLVVCSRSNSKGESRFSHGFRTISVK